MRVLDRAIAQFQNRPVFEIEVPEWGEGETPLIVYYKTPNAATLSRINREAKGDPIEIAARLVAERSLVDADGTKMFKPIDYKTLMVQADPAVFSRIAQKIMKDAKLDLSEPALDEAEKNSDATHSD